MTPKPPDITDDDRQRMLDLSRAIVRRERQVEVERSKLIRRVRRGGTKHEVGATKARPSKSTRRAKTKAARSSARKNRRG